MQMLQAMRLVVLALILPASAKTGGSCALQTKAKATKKGASQKSLQNQTEGDGFYQTRLWFRDCIGIFVEEGYALKQPIALNLENRSNYDLYLKPSGLCQNSIFCAYQDCTPPEACPELMRREIQQLAETPEVVTALLHKCPPDNLPATVVQAENVKDVIDGIALAKHWRTSVSVKTSGHSYAGSSTFQGSVLINMARYQKYARENVLECATLPTPIPLALNNAKNVGAMAAARGKQAVIRVGGGENWNEAYAAVFWYLTPLVVRRYHVVGGAAGTVSSIGGWLQGGGLSGSTGMRIWGFGVDQVLQIEMVLSNGKHVRFMPSEWETESGKLYPQTRKVSGECNENPVADESKWQWGPCSELGLDLSFEDLWFAVRGGGGGTYGVVTSAYYQLHDQVSPELELDYFVFLRLPAILPSCFSLECTDFLRSLWLDFLRAFFFPEDTEPWKDASAFCGAPQTASLDIFVADEYFCHGAEGYLQFLGVWDSFVDSANSTLATFGVSQAEIAFLKSQGGLFLIVASGDWYSVNMLSFPSFQLPPHMQQYPTQLVDGPPPATYPDTYLLRTILLPRSWIRTERALNVLLTLVKAGALAPAYILGAGTSVGGDGMDAVPEFQRNASFLLFLLDDDDDSEGLLRSSFDEYRDRPAKNSEDYPGGIQYNHISAVQYGPLKEDWTKACPSINTSMAERERRCVSLQEAVWGTTLLSKLEDVKKRADPGNLFKCFDCVGYKKRKRFNPRSRGGSKTPHFCVWPTYGGGCHRWWDHDPASDAKGLKKLKDELVSYAEHHGAKTVSEMLAVPKAAKMKVLEKVKS